MIHVEPKDLPVKEVHGYLLGGVAPRPIALVSTVSEKGVINLAPFSFFNAFGANPPTVAFSPSTRGRDGTKKDTYHNLVATGECAIQAVTYEMAEQISLASAEFPADIDEFLKSGLTPVPSDLVKPPRVAESPFQMECKLSRMVALGDGPGAGNLAICEIVKFHIAEDLFVDGIIDPDRIDLVGRNSGGWYTRACGQAMFEVPKPTESDLVGFDGLPTRLKASHILSANDLAQLAGVAAVPRAVDLADWIAEVKRQTVDECSREAFVRAEKAGSVIDMAIMLVSDIAVDPAERWLLCQRAAKVALKARDTATAWRVILFGLDNAD